MRNSRIHVVAPREMGAIPIYPRFPRGNVRKFKFHGISLPESTVILELSLPPRGK